MVNFISVDHSRVVLEKVNNEEGTDYINASYILVSLNIACISTSHVQIYIFFPVELMSF